MNLQKLDASALLNRANSTYLEVSEQAYNLKCVGHNADSHELLSVVSAVHHQRVGEALNDGTICLSKSLDSIATGRMGDVDRVPDLNVITIAQRSKLAKGSCWGRRYQRL